MPFRFSSITVSRSDSATASTAVGKNLPDGLPRHAADWKIQGDTRLSDAAIDTLAELALDIVEATVSTCTARALAWTVGSW